MTEALNLRTFYMLRGMKENVPRPRAPAGLAFENHAQGSSHSTGRCGRHQNLI